MRFLANLTNFLTGFAAVVLSFALVLALMTVPLLVMVHELLEPEILHVFEIFTRHERPIKDQNERSHFVTLVLAGLAPADFDTENQTVQPGQPGFMKWFSTLPDELLQVQNCYREQWETIQRKLKGRFYDGNLEK